MDELCDTIQYEEYCRFEPVTPNEWEEIKYAWMVGTLEDSPYLLADETALERAKERIH